MYAAVGVSEDC